MCDLKRESGNTPNENKISYRRSAARHLPHGWNAGQVTKLPKTHRAQSSRCRDARSLLAASHG